MKKTLKTSSIVSAFNLLNTAKLTKMEDSDKIRLVRVMRKFKPLFEEFNTAVKDAQEKLKPEGYDERFRKAQIYEVKNEESGMTEEEYTAFIDEFKQANKLIQEAVNDIALKDTELDLETLSEDAFGKFIASNDWTMEQIVLLSEVLCEA